ncbi:DUF3047 domain-containing protein [Limnohabitans sp. G3-2]|uniref:DUF3047 domain-containing protein n=1 Tax=Limnohabitans sp. G3-2 TaxID=1100711 RepID=UPI000C1F80BE|nr:DUF3047 domain-containing protein [Limnohabitans sp. G3-2]PIT74128.1 hypothetical protein B9Z31_09820 [Limnohabitans sp. G3-2]
MVFSGLWIRLGLGALGLAFLSGCATQGEPAQRVASPVLTQRPGGLHFSAQDKAQWEAVTLPGKLRTAFKLEKRQQREALSAQAEASASMLRQRLQVPADQLGRLQFAWQIDNLLAGADMGERDSEDSPVRVILAFEGDRSRFSAKNAMLSDLTEALTGEPLPYATLMYVWCNRRPVDTVIVNPRTDRVRKWVVDSGPAHIRQWRQHNRDVRADFEKAFGEAPGALVGVAIMTDSDNTRGHVRAWYGDIRLD